LNLDLFMSWQETYLARVVAGEADGAALPRVAAFLDELGHDIHHEEFALEDRGWSEETPWIRVPGTNVELEFEVHSPGQLHRNDRIRLVDIDPEDPAHAVVC
jgi:hypothetical protein